MPSRRGFIKQVALGGTLIGAGQLPLTAFSEPSSAMLTILHTNDMHSRIEPFPMDGGRNAGLGGMARRAALVEKIRAENEHVILLDAGDIFQGTPYFNRYKGELEIRLMSRMKYDVSCIGNHDFDAGIDGLAKQMQHASFPFVCANYDFADTVLSGRVQPHTILNRGRFTVGVFGLGIELAGLVPSRLYTNTKYVEPVEVANEMARKLKHEMGCNLVICLSHLGYRYRSDKVSDVVLAEKSRNIDLIIGGHTHTFMERPDVRKNLDGEDVLINQVGWAGIYLGKLECVMERRSTRLVSDKQPILLN